jgi:hypothetical protein
MRKWTAVIFLALSLSAAIAQPVSRDPERDDALNAAITTSTHIEFMFKRLALCAELNTANSATYILISSEFLRDPNVSQAIEKSDHLIDAEIRSVAGSPERADEAKASRKQQTETLYGKRRQQALAAPGPFQQDCRQLAQDFLLRH